MKNLLGRNNFTNHLHFENHPNSRVFQLDKCGKVLEMIARLKDRNIDLAETCEMLYGRNERGRIMCSESMQIKYNKNVETIKRLKSYYNYLIDGLKKF
jgi:hypothetical protein